MRAKQPAQNEVKGSSLRVGSEVFMLRVGNPVPHVCTHKGILGPPITSELIRGWRFSIMFLINAVKSLDGNILPIEVKMKDKRSPIKERPLRHPGQSLDEQIDRLLDEIYNVFLYVIVFFALAVHDWWKWLSKTPPSLPILGTIILVIIIIYTVIKITRNMKQIGHLKLGRDGEREVGQGLDVLRENGAMILHDVVSKDFNVDHVVVSPKGIFVIETKTYSKPVKGNPSIHMKAGQVYAGNYLIERNPIEQAKALGKWIEEILKQSSGKHFTVKPIVVFPGWFVEPMQGNEEVWVLNPKALPAFIKNNRQNIPPEDMHLAFFHLARYVRSLY